MRKEISFLIVTAIIALGIVLIYYWGGQPTGFVTIHEDLNESECAVSGYVWEEIMGEDENCTLCEEGCVEEYTEILCEEGCQETCEGNETCILCEEGCVEEYTEILCEEDCQEICEEIVVGGQCVEYVCDAEHLELCEDEINCTGAEGYWYDDVCNEAPEPILGCTNQYAMNYNPDATQDDGSCYECEIDSDCGEGYVCIEDYCEVPPEILEVPILEEIPVLMPSLSADEIQNLKLNPGATSEIVWNVRNDGGIFLSSCRFEAEGEYADWISFAGESPVDIGIGNTANFGFNLNVPEEYAEEGAHALDVAVKCAQTTVSKQFILEIETKKLEFDLIAADRTRLDRVRIIYSLGELTGEPQDVAVKFVLLAGAEEIAFIEENQSLKANATKEFKTNLPINESLEGELELVANYNSEVYSSSVREPIVLGAPIGGAAIFEGIGAGEIAIVVIVIVVLVVVLFVVKKIRSSGKTLKTLFQRKKEN